MATEVAFLLSDPTVIVEEKADGANCGMMLDGKNAVIRNRDHVLKKGYLKDTPAKAQFRPAWTWFYDNLKKFERLNHRFHYPVGVYGEWLWALHGVEYDAIPAYFVAFDIFDPEREGFIESAKSRAALTDAGFDCVPLLHEGPIPNWEFLSGLCNQKSCWSQEQREGIYVKCSHGGLVNKRFKMIRAGFKQGSRWSHDHLTRQKLAKGE